MTEAEHLLVCLMEECAEVQQRISKALRFGLNEVQQGNPEQAHESNRERIAQELDDLFGVYEMLCDRAIIRARRMSAIEAKSVKVEKYMTYARGIGTLPAPVQHDDFHHTPRCSTGGCRE